MKFIRLRESQSALQHVAHSYIDLYLLQKPEGVHSEESLRASERLLREHLMDPSHEFLAFDNKGKYVGFAEIELEEECFPDEDLPEVCLKVHNFYIEPEERKSGLGGEFFKMLRAWGHEKRAALIEMEVPAYDPQANEFLKKQGLELIGRGAMNGYRSFI